MRDRVRTTLVALLLAQGVITLSGPNMFGPDDLKKEDLSSGKNQKQSGKGLWNHIFFRFFSLVKVSGPPFITTLVVVLLKKNLCCIQTL